MLRILFYALVVILVLSFFGISIQSIVHSPTGEANFGYIHSLLLTIYHFFAVIYNTAIAWLATIVK